MIDDWIEWKEVSAKIINTWSGDYKGFDWRLGQALFNVLHKYNPVVADKVRGTAIDPFHRDDVISQFLEFVDDNWEN